MEKTPVQKSKWSRKQGTYKNASEDRKINTSPKHIVDSEGPLQIPLTQEAWENVDVVWDWNSPQGKPHPKKSQKRLVLPPSPKITIKRHPSHNSIQNFEKLRGELQALREEIAENEDLLQLSPAAEADYKNLSDINLLEEEFQNDNFEDLFNSPVNAQLIEFGVLESATVSSNTNITKKEGIVSPSKSISFKKIDRNYDVSKIANDSFEALLGEVDIEQLTNSKDSKAETTKHSELNHSTLQGFNFHKSSGKVEFFRTESFELSNVEQITGIAKEQLDDIERKRREALAKLGLKRKQDLTVSPTSQCSHDEIEKKRRQALAKLEAKREQEIIEKKRQEALKRLQDRKKYAPIVKSSLTKRLNYETS